MNSTKLITAITALANAIARGLSNEEINLVATVLVQLGDTLSTISAHRSLREEHHGGAPQHNRLSD